VKDQAFLKQFVGKTVASGFQVGKDIDGISGATISSKAVSEALRKASFGFKTFVRR
jgi:Na+-translocating ferredoxin:NAD+ oxidoreductase RnfG subunit